MIEEYFNIVRLVMPKRADIRLNTTASDTFKVRISWNIDDDPDRPNKRSKIIHIIVDRETLSDVAQSSDDKKKISMNNFRQALERRLTNF